MLVIARWLVLYQVEAADVRIARIVDAARNLGELDLSGRIIPQARQQVLSAIRCRFESRPLQGS
jgi:hypothetical protein